MLDQHVVHFSLRFIHEAVDALKLFIHQHIAAAALFNQLKAAVVFLLEGLKAAHQFIQRRAVRVVYGLGFGAHPGVLRYHHGVKSLSVLAAKNLPRPFKPVI